jgi:hypothetical protein
MYSRRRMQTGEQLGKGNKYRTVTGTLLLVYRYGVGNTCNNDIHLISGVYISGSENYIYPPPPPEKDIFPPLTAHYFSTPVVSFLPWFFPVLHLYFTLLLPVFSYKFFSPFFLLLLHFPSFYLPLFKFLPQMTLVLPRGGEGRDFTINRDPCLIERKVILYHISFS